MARCSVHCWLSELMGNRYDYSRETGRYTCGFGPRRKNSISLYVIVFGTTFLDVDCPAELTISVVLYTVVWVTIGYRDTAYMVIAWVWWASGCCRRVVVVDAWLLWTRGYGGRVVVADAWLWSACGYDGSVVELGVWLWWMSGCSWRVCGWRVAMVRARLWQASDCAERGN